MRLKRVLAFASALLPALAPAGAAAGQGFVVLIPGAGSSGSQVYVRNLPNLLGSRYFGKYQDELNAAGVDNLVCPKTPDEDRRSLEEREQECVQMILAHEAAEARAAAQASGCKQRNVVLMGHSMGGLIARELAQDPRVASCIKSVITVSTPHHGTPIADFAIDHAHALSHGFDFYGSIASFIGFTQENLRYLAELRIDRDGYPAATFEAQDLPDNPAIRYFSVSSSFASDWLNPLEIMRGIVAGEMKRLKLDDTGFGALNDGVVPEYSQIHGTYLGHLSINHFEAACVDLVQYSSGCRKAADFLIPILKSQVVLN